MEAPPQAGAETFTEPCWVDSPDVEADITSGDSTINKRAIREVERQTAEPFVKLDKLLQTAHRIYAQQKHDKNKIYSVHEPEVLSPGPILALHVVMLSPRAWARSTANFSESGYLFDATYPKR